MHFYSGPPMHLRSGVDSFRKTALDIDAKEVRAGPGTQLDITLATLLFLLGAILFVYLSYTVLSRF